MTKKLKKEILFYLIAAGVVMIVMGMLFDLHVQSRSKARALFDNRMYEERELVYQQQIREILNDWYLGDSGIMLTHTCDIDGNRTYRMEIHNRRFHMLNEGESETIYRDICEVEMFDVSDLPLEVDVVITK